MKAVKLPCQRDITPVLTLFTPQKTHWFFYCLCQTDCPQMVCSRDNTVLKEQRNVYSLRRWKNCISLPGTQGGGVVLYVQHHCPSGNEL